MANLIGIMGEPATGKTSSLRRLEADITCYIDCDCKGLNWRGWRDEYNAEKENYIKTSNPKMVIAAIKQIDEEPGLSKFKYIVVDTVNNLMTAEEMRSMNEKGYDKWKDLAIYAWDIINAAGEAKRDDLTVILLFHTQTEINDNGYMFTKIKTNGRKIEKNDIESKFNWLLRTRCIDGKYYFETQANQSTARTPLEAFKETLIPNDITLVTNILKEF